MTISAVFWESKKAKPLVSVNQLKKFRVFLYCPVFLLAISPQWKFKKDIKTLPNQDIKSKRWILIYPILFWLA